MLNNDRNKILKANTSLVYLYKYIPFCYANIIRKPRDLIWEIVIQ